MFAVVLAVAVLTLAISAAVRFAATSTWWWERGFERFDAPERTGLAEGEVSRIGAEVRAYFRDDEERLAVRYGGELPFFSEREVQHMVDVKVLLARTWDAGWAAFGLLAAIAIAGVALRGRFDCRAAARAAAWGGVGAAAIIGVLAVVAVSGFDGAFRQFHLLFFTNDLWMLSSRDRLIQLFPQGFFFETTLLIGAAAVIGAAACSLAGWAWLRRTAVS